MLVCQKTTNLFINFACGLVCSYLIVFSFSQHMFQKYSDVRLGLWFVSKKIKARLYLFNLLGNINFAKRVCIYTCRQENYYSSFLLGILKFFCIIYLLHFFPFYRTHPLLECFGNFFAHHKLYIKMFLQLKEDIKSDS